MLIVPVSGQPDWRRPPLVLLLLILLNVLIFFGVQGRDDERAMHAARYYADSTLPKVELPRYVAELERLRPADALPLQEALNKIHGRILSAAAQMQKNEMDKLHLETEQQRLELLRIRATGEIGEPGDGDKDAVHE